MPRAYLRGLSKFDAVIVPSEFCADVIDGTLRGQLAAWNDDGNPDPDEPAVPDVYIVPHCFDPSFWVVPPSPRRDDGIVRFYGIGAWGERKNQLGVLRAYLSEFDKTDAVHLHMQIEGCDFDEVRSLLARSGLAINDLEPQLPPMTILDDTDPLTEAQLVQLHADNDCFVTATRCEGWGLGLFEAAIMGRHVIAPLWGGQSDFLDDYGLAEAVPYQLTPCFGTERKGPIEQHMESAFAAGVTLRAARVSIPPGVDCRQKWADPDLCALAARMRYVYEMKKGTVAVPFISPAAAHAERSELDQKFGYRAVGATFVNTLQEIM